MARSPHRDLQDSFRSASAKGRRFALTYDLSSRQREILLEGGGIRYLKLRRGTSR